MSSTPLRYHISDWHQLVAIKSNNSRELSISVTDFVQDNKLNGLRIQIRHTQYGVLFSVVVNSSGTLISDISDTTVYSMSISQIITELGRWGFFVEYTPAKHLPSNQLSYLMKLRDLNYDKIRVLSVYRYENGLKVFRWYVVAFNVSKNSNWIDNAYSPSINEYSEALINGSAVNVLDNSNRQKWDWSWLDYVANINDILEDNA